MCRLSCQVLKDAVLHLVSGLGRALAGYRKKLLLFKRGGETVIGTFTNDHLIANNEQHRQQVVKAARTVLETLSVERVDMCVTLGTGGVTACSTAGDFSNKLNRPLLGRVDGHGQQVMALHLLHGVYATDTVSCYIAGTYICVRGAGLT